MPPELQRCVFERHRLKDFSFNRVNPLQASLDVIREDLLPDGHYYGTKIEVDERNKQFTFDQVQWFSGEAAEKACAEDRQDAAGGEWCHNYYVRNANPKLRTMPFAPAVRITALFAKSSSEPLADLRALSMLLRDHSERVNGWWEFDVQNGQIASLTEVYTP
jgi:hypothetical protein